MVSTLSAAQKTSVIALWNKEYPIQLHYQTEEEFDKYLDQLTDISHYLISTDQGEIKGWANTFNRDNEKWFAIIIGSSLQGKGYGHKLLSEIKKMNRELNGWVVDHNDYQKLDGSPYQSPLLFYTKNDFKVLPSKRIESTVSAVKIHWTKDQA
ncbi:GNAT family N-acetyltransferase [Fabibacter sp. E12]|nr:GNAT family N-acetyltransferase [Roseivirga sp. E12]MBO3700519.1 GNAT family N-acetyltransferase [Roseivirga sp. E12]